MLPGTERPPTDGSAAVVAVAALAQARLQLFTGVERPPRDRVVEAELAGVQVQLQPQHRAAYRQQPALLLLRRQRLVSAATQLRALQRRSRQSPVGSYCQYSRTPRRPYSSRFDTWSSRHVLREVTSSTKSGPFRSSHSRYVRRR